VKRGERAKLGAGIYLRGALEEKKREREELDPHRPSRFFTPPQAAALGAKGRGRKRGGRN